VRAVRPFFEEWYPRLVRFLRARLGDADEAEDIAQEAFVRLLRCQPEHPKAWLFAVANNLASDQARVTKGRARHLALLGADIRERQDPGPEQPLLRAEEGERVRRALASLSERDRMLLLLHHEGFRYRDIAHQLGLAPGSIGSLLTRAQRRFARTYEMTGHGNEQSASG
jgi:RNA polymerase sigma-70 factor (ECF subfamily)